MPFTESDIKNYRCHADAVIAEIYPLLKNAVSPHAATYIKKDMLRLKEHGLDERMTLEENKTFFHEIAHMHCDAAITAQIRYSNKSYRATLTKESILEKCRICDLDAQSVKQILKAACFDAGGDQHE